MSLNKNELIYLSKAKMGVPSSLKGKPGQKASDEVKAKMSKARVGSGNSRAVKVRLQDGTEFGCKKDALEFLNISRARLDTMLRKGIITMAVSS